MGTENFEVQHNDQIKSQSWDVKMGKGDWQNQPRYNRMQR